MDNTLSLLYTSSQSRGLPHRVTRNMAQLQIKHLKWAKKHYYSSSGHWKPNLDPSSDEYKPKHFTQRAKNREEKRRRQDAFERCAWGAMGEVVRMAEARHRISLGRVTFNERRA